MSTSTKAKSQETVQAKSLPFYRHRIRLNSFHAQQLYDRIFQRTARAIYSLSVVLRVIGTEEQAREVEGIIEERMNNILNEMRNESERASKLAESNGIDFGTIEYSNPRDIDVKIDSPNVMRCVVLIREFDVLIEKLDTIWLSGIITNDKYLSIIYQWKRSLYRLFNMIYFVSRRTFASAYKEKNINESNIDEEIINESKKDGDVEEIDEKLVNEVKERIDKVIQM
jgi:hypothetical protein